MKTYLFSYNYNGSPYTLEMKADTLTEAKERVGRVQFATYDGELVAKIMVPTFMGRLIALIFGKR